MFIANEEYEEIQIMTEEGELIASITDDDVIGKKDYRVVCIPKNS